MSASDHLSELQFEVHRGVNTSYPHYPEKGGSSQYTLDTENLGSHWSTDPAVAQRFSHKWDTPTWRAKYARIIHATVPVSSVETSSEEIRKRGVDTHGVLNESEVPVRKGATVKVTGITRLRQSGEKIASRTRRYKKPREMTA